MKKIRTYFGIFIYGKTGEWHCELIDDKFSTLKDIKEYIKDYIETEN